MTIYVSPFAEAPIPAVSITELVFAGLERRAAEPVIVDGPSGRALTGGALRGWIERLAGGFAARGIGRGSVAAIMAPNAPEFVAAFHGAAFAGAAVTTLNPGCTADEARHQLRDAGAGLLLVAPALVTTARAAAEGTGVREIVALGAAEGATPLAALEGAPLRAQAPIDPETDVAALPYSSGTTGLPKGVMLTHRNPVANVVQVGQIVPIAPGTPTLAFLPYFHIYGMTVLMNLYLARGGLQVTLPRFELEAALRLIEAHRVEHLFVAPPVVLALAKHPKAAEFDLSSLRFVLSGAAPLGAELAAACAARIGCETVQGYGMTEMSPVSHFTPPGRDRPGASGLLTPGAEARVVDPETGADAAPGAAGELWVRGPQVMQGYLGNPAATTATFAEGDWLRTGDVARIDADGYLFIVDRVKELIKVKGFQVAPAELEALIVTHPGVADAAVFGEPCAEAGERPVARVVLAPDEGVEAEELIDFVAARVASYKRLARVEFAEAIPKSPSGKILRRLLRQR